LPPSARRQAEVQERSIPTADETCKDCDKKQFVRENKELEENELKVMRYLNLGLMPFKFFSE
jgi:hypothetical protein